MKSGDGVQGKGPAIEAPCPLSAPSRERPGDQRASFSPADLAHPLAAQLDAMCIDAGQQGTRKLPSARAIARSRNSARPLIQRRVAVAASLLRERASDEALARAGGSQHEHVLWLRTHAESCVSVRITLLSGPRGVR